MTAATVFSTPDATPMPCGQGNSAEDFREHSREPSPEPTAPYSPEPSHPSPAGAAPISVVAFEPLTAYGVYGMLEAQRAAVHAELKQLRAEGAPLNVPPDIVFLCELAGLVLDLETGFVTGLADGHVAPVPQLRARLQTLGFVLPAGQAPAVVNVELTCGGDLPGGQPS